MILPDSSVWIEYFVDGPKAAQAASYLEGPEQVAVPTIVSYEVYKTLKRDLSEEGAMSALARMGRAESIPLDQSLAMSAADISLGMRLAMADAIVLAAARFAKAKLVTLDADFAGIPEATVL